VIATLSSRKAVRLCYERVRQQYVFITTLICTSKRYSLLTHTSDSRTAAQKHETQIIVWLQRLINQSRPSASRVTADEMQNKMHDFWLMRNYSAYRVHRMRLWMSSLKRTKRIPVNYWRAVMETRFSTTRLNELVSSIAGSCRWVVISAVCRVFHKMQKIEMIAMMAVGFEFTHSISIIIRDCFDSWLRFAEHEQGRDR
jgi:hypothetical protein